MAVKKHSAGPLCDILRSDLSPAPARSRVQGARLRPQAPPSAPNALDPSLDVSQVPSEVLGSGFLQWILLCPPTTCLKAFAWDLNRGYPRSSSSARAPHRNASLEQLQSNRVRTFKNQENDRWKENSDHSNCSQTVFQENIIDGT